MSRRRWTPDELAQLRTMRDEGLTLEEIGRRLGRTVKSVHHAIANYQLPRRRRARVDRDWLDRLRQGVVAGVCDACVARVLGCERHTVGDWRKRLDLPASPAHDCPRCNDHRRNLLARQCREWNARSFAEIKRTVVAERAVAAGWPADLSPREVEILDLLHSRGPMTRRELYAAMGLIWPGVSRKAFSNGQDSYTGRLLNRGLVVVLGRVARGGKGRNEWVYSLPLWVEKGAL